MFIVQLKRKGTKSLTIRFEFHTTWTLSITRGSCGCIHSFCWNVKLRKFALIFPVSNVEVCISYFHFNWKQLANSIYPVVHLPWHFMLCYAPRLRRVDPKTFELMKFNRFCLLENWTLHRRQLKRTEKWGNHQSSARHIWPKMKEKTLDTFLSRHAQNVVSEFLPFFDVIQEENVDVSFCIYILCFDHLLLMPQPSSVLFDLQQNGKALIKYGLFERCRKRREFFTLVLVSGSLNLFPFSVLRNEYERWNIFIKRTQKAI